MTEVERIVDQFRRALEGEAWHGPALLELLNNVGAEQAAAHPIPTAHSIWELVLHIAAWKNVCRRRLAGDPAQLTDAENFPVIGETTEEAWQHTKQELVDTHRDLLAAISGVDESRFDKPIIEDPAIAFSTVYVTLQGCVQHDLYHAGQIAILKKTFGA